MQNQTEKDMLGSGWMIVAALSFTLMNLWVKSASQQFGLGSGELVFWRMSFATLFLGFMAKMQGKSFASPHWKAHLSRSVSGTLGMFCIFHAITHLPLATGVTLGYTSSIFLAVLSFIVLKERVSLYTQLVLALGFIGVVVLLNPSFQSGQEWAAVVGLCGGALAAWAYLKVRELSLLGEPGWRVVFYLSLVGTVLSAGWATITGWHPINLNTLPYLLGIGASALVAQLCLTRAYKVGDKFTVASLSYLTVVFSSLAGVWFLGDKISWQEVLGMGIIVISGILSGMSPLWLRKFKLFR
ncbi:DMT family transporter [Neisseria animaloris]|uniref:Predicted permease, DMT superfamily n=1 Tax=Neisseria animaloris TaxID=326522 RepID=A0A448UC41_9NEIS|nr:DMT family transporter [Neisseria animaloris]VEJ21459.1 Predicted permease, DMT superfamily [Neisseria animaloris]